MVNEDDLVLAMLLNNIRVNYVDFRKDYRERSIIQWKIYLLEQIGFKLSNCFDWGRPGIYSYDLSEKLYDCLTSMEFDDLKGYTFKKQFQNYLDSFNEIEKEKPDTVDIYNWWLLLSSISYWKNLTDDWKDNLNQLLSPNVLVNQELADVCLTKHIRNKGVVK